MSDENDSKTNIYSHGYVSMQKEISALRTRLEKSKQRNEIVLESHHRLEAENAVLKQKLERITAWANTDTYLYDHKAIQNITIAKESGYEIAQKIVREILSW